MNPSWIPLVSSAAGRQKACRREAEGRRIGIAQVLDTLAGSAPCNPADLAAITAEAIHAIGRDIRHGNTNGYRKYWNMAQGSKPTRKHEEDCRDILLSDLRRELECFEVQVDPEGRYADEARADIKVSHGTYNIPIEIKCNDHRELWTAIQGQLVAKYSRDPGADGHGIYLVLWFGSEGTPRPPEGTPPTDAAELEERLRERLSADERRRVTVVVIDCALPAKR